jgi:formylglycine-generating enzyme required for sulfatase activity
LDAYFMDVFEVTVAKYKACADAGKCTAPITGSKYNWGVPAKEPHPVNGVTWTQADGYCKWTDAKGHLPSEAQWEMAARGGLDDKKYPWADSGAGDAEPTCTPGQANTAVWSSGGSGGCGTGTTWPVGTGSAKNGYGLYDMAGNALEWAADWYGASYYCSSPAANPAGPASGSSRVERGGSYDSDVASALRVSKRTVVGPSYANFDVGFRCARSTP